MVPSITIAFALSSLVAALPASPDNGPVHVPLVRRSSYTLPNGDADVERLEASILNMRLKYGIASSASPAKRADLAKRQSAIALTDVVRSNPPFTIIL
jgi:hypothetical protein